MQSATEALKVCRYMFLIFPPYALGGGLLDMIDNQVRTTIYNRFNVDAYKDPFTFGMIGWNMVAMGIEGLLFLILAIWMDAKCGCDRYSVVFVNLFLFSSCLFGRM